MAAMNLFEAPRKPGEWSYDAEADTPYISLAAPRPAVGIDLGDGLIVRYDEAMGKVVGMTIVGIGERVAEIVADRR